MIPAGHDSIYPNGEVITRVVYVGGRNKIELLEDLRNTEVQLNELGIRLLSSEAFQTSEAPRPLITVELTVRDLGYPQGATISEIYDRAATLGLALCPVELGPHLRLQYLDQPEGFLNQPSSKHQAPPGSVTIASKQLEADDDFPQGFYLRRIEGTPWLRGYQCGPDHLWKATDRFIFLRSSLIA